MMLDLKEDVATDGELAHVRDDDLERALLILLFIKWYGTVLRAVHQVSTAVLGLGPIAVDTAAIAQQVLNAQAAAVAVDAATQKLIAERIAEGLRMGLTTREIAYGTKDFPGIDGLFEETWKNRPLTVAKTELQKAQLEATKQRFQTLGRGRVSGWLARDGDFDEYCAGRDGVVFPLNNPPSLAHPHCRLTLSPILR